MLPIHAHIPNWDFCSELREDESWMQSALASPGLNIVPVFQGCILLSDEHQTNFLEPNQNSWVHELMRSDDIVFLGSSGGAPFFSFEVSSESHARLIEAKTGYSFKAVRPVINFLDTFQGPVLTLASFMSHWHGLHRYCGKCGRPTQSKEWGHIRFCSHSNCKSQYFPSMDPAVIVLVTHGDKVLLGRNPRWPKGMESILAGFVEPGETAEAAVAREIKEEAGIQVTNIRYQCSQPWLHPASLMLAYTAEAVNTDIHIDGRELEYARWYTRDEIRKKLKHLPPSVSVARRMITIWVNGEF